MNILDVVKLQIALGIIFVSSAMGFVRNGIELRSSIENEEPRAGIDIGAGNGIQIVDVVSAFVVQTG